jgi:hypothetical protein
VSHHLHSGFFTSDQRDAAFDNVFGLLVEVEAIGADAGMNGGTVEEALDHSKEVCACSEGVAETGVECDRPLEDVVDHHISYNPVVITTMSIKRYAFNKKLGRLRNLEFR